MQIKVGNRVLGDNSPCFIIAEIGINFNGSLELAKKLIDTAVEAGCDAAKFQAFTADNLYPKTAGELDWEDDQGKYSYSIHENVKKFELPKEWVTTLKQYCAEKGIIFFSSICDEEQADFYDKLGTPIFKTTSYAITHLPLIEHLAKKGKPLIISTGGATLEEIKEAYQSAKKYTDKIILLHCIIKYPAPLADINMKALETLQKEFPDAIIGYSDHTAEVVDAPLAAVVKGAKVIEKHITLDKKMQGPDHFFALNPVELKEMVNSVRTAEEKIKRGEKVEVNPLVLGSPEKKITPSEEYLRNFAYQTIITSAPIKKGEIMSKNNLKVLRPGKLGRKLEPKEYPKLTSGFYKATKDLPEGSLLDWNEVEQTKNALIINGKEIPENYCYTIAEIASAHCGSMEKLKHIVKSSVEAGVDAVKFQIFNVDYFVSTFHPNYPNNKKNQFSKEQWKEIFEFAQQFKVDIWADVFDEGSVDIADQYVHGFKLHSTDVTNPFMLEYVAKINKPLILAAGGATIEELKKAVHKLQQAGNNQIILSHGFQAYPTEVNKVNLKRLQLLKQEFPNVVIGYHNHTNAELDLAITMPVAAFAYGAKVIEKHVTDDRSLKGFDYESSLNPSELKELVQQLRAFESSIGIESFAMSEEEIKYRNYTKRYIVAKRNLKAGQTVTIQDLSFKRSSPIGIGASEYTKLVGRTALRDIQADETILPKDVENKAAICLAVRLKSTRLPRKAVLDIEGQTAIEHQIDRLKRCKNGELILCTSTLEEDAPLIEIAKKKGIKYFAGNADDVMDRFLNASSMIDANLIVRTTGDCPVIDPQVVDTLIEHQIKTAADYTGIEDVPIGFEAEVVYRSTILDARTRVKDPKDTEFMTWFIKDPKHFKVEILPVDENLKRNYRMTLDTPKDLEAISAVFKGLYNVKKEFTLKDVVEFLDAHPEIASLNMDYQQIKRPPKLEVMKQKTILFSEAR